MKSIAIILLSLCLTQILCEDTDDSLEDTLNELNEDTLDSARGKCDKDKYCKGIELNEKLLRRLNYKEDAKVLDLSHLCIEKIAPNTFQKYQRVVKIDLSFNKISKIAPPVFSNLKYLLELQLNNNKIKEILPNSFDDLVSLEILNLNFNFLTALSSPTLNPMINLLELYVANNRLTFIDWDTQNLVKMLVFDVHSNNIQYISACKEPHGIDCPTPDEPTGYDYQQVYFDISYNNLTSIGYYDVSLIRRLQFFNVRHNNIQYIDPSAFIYNGALVFLYLDHNELSEIKPGTFSCICNINDCINNCSDSSYLGCQMQMRELNLAYNKLTKVKQFDFARLTRLEDLVLSYNHIGYIEENSFAKNMNLRTLKLDYNEIKEIKDKTFAGLWSLQVLNLDYNKICKIEKCAFKDLGQLEVVCLYGNPISGQKPNPKSDEKADQISEVEASSVSEEKMELSIVNWCAKESNPICPKIKTKKPCSCYE